MIEQVEFDSQGTTLRGDLYIAKTNSGTGPTIIMAHGFTTTIRGMTADKYAEEFQKAGYSVLLYDHRNFGISDGEPRQEINFWLQARGYIDAIDYIESRTEIDSSKIVIWGASLSAREAFLVGAVDRRISAIINIVPAYGDDLFFEDPKETLYPFAVETLKNKNIADLPQTRTESIPVVSKDQKKTPSALIDLSAYDWFMKYGVRPETKWKNEVSFSTLETPEKFHMVPFATHLVAPILMIIAKDDKMEGANPSVSREIFELIFQPKVLFEIGGDHFGLLYYPGALFNQASKAQIDFLKKLF